MDRGTVGYLGVYGVYALSVNAVVGRLRAGGFKGISKRWKKSRTFPFFDYWSLTHVAFGVLAPFFSVERRLFLLLNTLNEVYEQVSCRIADTPWGKHNIYFASTCDPLLHSLFDILYGQIGYNIGVLIKRR